MRWTNPRTITVSFDKTQTTSYAKYEETPVANWLGYAPWKSRENRVPRS